MKTLVRSRIKLILICSFFILPVILAWYLVFFTDYKITGKGTEHGKLIIPAVSLSTLKIFDESTNENKTLEGKWNLVIIVRDICDKNCEMNLYKLRQIRLALGKDRDSVQRVVYLKDNLNLSKNQLKNFQGQLTIPEGKAKEKFYNQIVNHQIFDYDSIYLVDPYLNLMMKYPAAVNPSGIIKDLERLIRISK